MTERYRGPIVDADIHHGWKSWSDIVDYMPREWQEYARSNVSPYPRSGVVNFNTPAGAMRRDSYPEDGSAPGSDWETFRAQVLDRYNYYRGVLTFNIGGHVGIANHEFAMVVARAVHDWNSDTWLQGDERLYGCAAVPLHLPEAAAVEVHRQAENDRVVALLFSTSPLVCPYGDPAYEPVIRAAAETELPIDVHIGYATGERNPGGKFTSNQASVPLMFLDAMHHITSFIIHGTFERYPNLRVMMKEYGLAWLPSLMWRLDKNYDLMKLESRWVRKRPSEYIYSNIMFDTQPLEESTTNPTDVNEVLTSIDGLEDMLCFATDYPHLSFDDPNHVASQLPAGWARKVMCDNACGYYGFEIPAEDAVFENPSLAGIGA